jgi:hypothetical protein
MGMALVDFQQQILGLLQTHPFLWTVAICRKLNHIKHIRYCRYCKAYANIRKRTRYPFRLHSPCAIPLSKVSSTLKKLEREKMIGSKWRVLPDGYNTRGYDRYHVYFLHKKDPDRHQHQLPV